MQDIQIPNSDSTFLGRSIFQRLLGSSETAGDIKLRVICLLAVTYGVLIVLAFSQGVAVNGALKESFCTDVSELSRFLVVGPLLLICERLIEPWLAQVMQYTKERLIPESALARFKRSIAIAKVFRDSIWVELILLSFTYIWQAIDVHSATLPADGTWKRLPATGVTYAWLWYAYFAKPLIRFLWLRWIWHYLVWAVLLCRTATMNLKIMPIHPDRQGGLHFVSVGHGRFCVLAFTFGIQAASVIGQQILYEGKTLMSFQYQILAVMLMILVLFLSPLLAFTSALLKAKRLGLFEYGALADEYTVQFRSKWIGHTPDNTALLGTADIQSLADIGNAYTVVKEMKTCLIGKEAIINFVVATMIPFLPLLLTVYPFDELIKQLVKTVM